MGGDAPSVAAQATLASQTRGRVGEALQRYGAVLSSWLLTVQKAALAVGIVVVLISVFLRYVLNQSLPSEDTLLEGLLAWITFLGLARAEWAGKLIGLGLWKDAHGPTRAVVHGVRSGATCAFFSAVLYSWVGSLPTQSSTQLGTLGISNLFVAGTLGVGAGLGILLQLVRTIPGERSALRWTVTAASFAGAFALVLTGFPGGLWDFLVLILFVLMDIPIAVAIGLTACMLAVGQQFADSATVISLQELSAPQNVALMALPMFMVMGGVVAESSMAETLGRFLTKVLGWLPGGVGISCVASSAIFANMTGSAIADTAAIGSVYIPQLQRAGYSADRAAALQAAAGVVGVVFPPAIALIIYSTIANVSVVHQFLAAIVPGLLLVVGMSVVVVYQSLRRPPGEGLGVAMRQITLWRALVGALPVLVIPVVLDGGIFTGVFAPFEAGGVAFLVAVVLALGLRQLAWGSLNRALERAADTTTMAMVILASVSVLQFGLFASGVSVGLQRVLLIGAISVPLFWVIINLVLLVVHEFMETFPAILLLAPFALPIAARLHISPLQLGVVLVVNSTIGIVLPPLGVNLYVTSELARVDSKATLRHVVPYVCSSFVVLALVSAFPGLSLHGMTS